MIAAGIVAYLWLGSLLITWSITRNWKYGPPEGFAHWWCVFCGWLVWPFVMAYEYRQWRKANPTQW